MNWYDARDTCWEHGWNLTSILSETEDNNLNNYLVTNDCNFYMFSIIYLLYI